MNVRPRISVILPTRRRPRQLRACLDALARQSAGPGSFEVLIIHDGQDPEGLAVSGNAPEAIRAHAIEAERLGNAHTKNLGLEAAGAPLVVFINDDILPEPDFIEAHLRAHAQSDNPRSAMILGYSPFVPPPPGDRTVFDAMLRDTSLIFFYDRMLDANECPLKPPDHDWGFRHAWSLNLSCQREAAFAAGGFRPAIANCCYEDIEFAFRVNRTCGAPVLFRPDARAAHDHRISPEDYFRREWRLGYSAFGFAHAAPECARATFNRDILAPAELEEALEFIRMEGSREPAAMADFLDVVARPTRALSDTERQALLARALDLQRPLKRLAWRRGFLAAASGKIIPDLFHPAHDLQTAPGLAAATTRSV